ncbi:unnamed protein product [Staurois parvus]|uniref:Uncharacterized protein n=1 Tax=Staurois parvus TaxID=386267 RepID=A0ABN9B4K8_9NEOB|nr:unnamed protein product [Staurois parvus]
MTRDCGHSTGDDQKIDCGHSTGDDQRLRTRTEMTRDCGHSTGDDQPRLRT